MLSPTTLAFVGDSIYELKVREKLVSDGNTSPYKLHKMCVEYVNASAQAKAFHRISGYLTDEELGIHKRGRNANNMRHPKNANQSDYRIATGLEALIGYLHLIGNTERLSQIMDKILTTHESDTPTEKSTQT